MSNYFSNFSVGMSDDIVRPHKRIVHRMNHHSLKTALHKARIAEMGTLPRNRLETIEYLSSLEDSDTIVKTDPKNDIIMIFDMYIISNC